MKEKVVLCTSFNMKGTLFACGFEDGFGVYQSDPLRIIVSRHFAKGGIGHIELLDDSNIIAMVGGGKQPLFSPNTVMLWDESIARFVAKVEAPATIVNIRITKERLIVATIKCVYMYKLPDLTFEMEKYTYDNVHGIIAVNNKCVAIPGKDRGSISIIYNNGSILNNDAHENSVRYAYLSNEGKYLCTASEKGTVIRLFDTEKEVFVENMRRGIEKAIVYSLCISQDEKYVVCISDKGTLHVFSISPSPVSPWITMLTPDNKSICKQALTTEEGSLFMDKEGYIYLISVSGSLLKFKMNEDQQLTLIENTKFTTL